MNDLINRQVAIKAINNAFDRETLLMGFVRSIAVRAIRDMPSAQQWIPVSERLPKIHQYVLLSTDCGHVLIGRMEKPDIIWQVTESDGRKHWVYDPEAYTDDIDELPKAEDISFEGIGTYKESMLSVTSLNFSNKSECVVAWMPLPEPYGGGGEG